MAALDDRIRGLLARAASAGEMAPVDPLAWAGRPGPDDPPGVSRYMAQIWRERIDLQEAFPGLFLDPDQRDRFLLWAHHFAAAEAAAPPELVPTAPPGVSDLAAPTLGGPRPLLVPGVTVVGYLRAVLGLGGSARRLAHLADLAGERVLARSYDHVGSPLDHPWTDDSQASANDRNDIAMLCVNGSETARLTRALGPRVLHGRYRIGLWFWELEVLPPAMTEGFAHLDEVWVTSEFVRDAVAAAAPPSVAVRVIPLGTDLATTPADSGLGVTRAAIGLPSDGILLGLTFDYSSRVERKNPLGLLEAFRRAFPRPFSLGDDRGPWLVLKTLNAGLHGEDAATVGEAARGAGPDVIVIDRQFTFPEQRALLRELDVVVSLHRSEGYGNSLLEAMGHAHPVIATGYSGNLAFMTAANSWLIPYVYVSVLPGSTIYPEGVRWADPDLNSAATVMREVVLGLDGDAVRLRAERGAADVAAVNDGSLGASFIRRRLSEIRAEEAAGVASASGYDAGRPN